jgi:regulatory protein
VRLLAARDRSEHEIRARLAAADVRPTAIDATVRRLQRLRYLDDRRFADGTAERAVRDGHGSVYVRARLSMHGVTESLIDAAVDAAFTDEAALARRVLARRYPHVPAAPRERAKAARFLSQRGFPDTVVLAILEEGC